MNEKKKSNQESDLIEWKDFLESTPPSGKIHLVSGVVKANPPPANTKGLNWKYSIQLPNLDLFCDTEICGGIRQFSCSHYFTIPGGSFSNHYLMYRCNNCDTNQKIYAIRFKPKGLDDKAEVIKLGEYLPFGAPLPAKLITLIGSDREYFLQGWRAENQGMGIGAFVYYRRVVENQKDELIQKIINVANKIKAPKEMIQRLEEAKKETQFSKAIDKIKDAIPESLKIKTHNPLKLIHGALSGGIHNKTDEECLEQARYIRVLLTEFSERLAEALKDDAELNEAIKKLTGDKR